MDKANDKLDMFYYGDFSFDKILKLQKYPNIHIYSKVKWPIHNFIGIVTEKDLPEIRATYNQEITIE